MADIPAHFLAAPRPEPIPFPDCTGHITHRLGRPDHTHGECFRCIRWSCGKGGHDHSRIVTAEDGTPSCKNLRSVLTGDQVAAMDDTGGVHGGCTVRAIEAPQVSQALGGCGSVQQHSGEVS